MAGVYRVTEGVLGSARGGGVIRMYPDGSIDARADSDVKVPVVIETTVTIDGVEYKDSRAHWTDRRYATTVAENLAVTSMTHVLEQVRGQV